MTQQAEFCRMMAERLAESVAIREEALRKNNGHVYIGYTIQAVQGTGKYQIKEDIKRLRRELQRLSQMVEEGG